MRFATMLLTMMSALQLLAVAYAGDGVQGDFVLKCCVCVRNPPRQKRVHNTHTTRGGVGAGEAQTDLI